VKVLEHWEHLNRCSPFLCFPERLHSIRQEWQVTKSVLEIRNQKPDNEFADSFGFGCTIYSPGQCFNTGWGFLLHEQVYGASPISASIICKHLDMLARKLYACHMVQSDETIQSLGGQARAQKLSAERRTEIARTAAESRWAKKPMLSATHTGELRIGEISIPCAVLEDGTRVLWQQGFLRAIGRTGRAAESAVTDESLQLPVFLRAENLKRFVSSELAEASTPIPFRPIISSRGGVSFGYKAELLPRVCNVFLEAADEKVLLANQRHIYERSKILVRGLAVVGITALVDEATGYQKVRDREALQAILDAYLRKELAAWAKRFPDEFYEQIFRLRGWQWKGMKVNRPQVVAKYTTDLVYERLAPNILAELETRNPRNSRGNRDAKHHQWLTEDVGHPALAQHLYGLIGFMRAADSWSQFYNLVQRAYPKKGETLLLPLAEAKT
jgi:hypothetical protein